MQLTRPSKYCISYFFSCVCSGNHPFPTEYVVLERIQVLKTLFEYTSEIASIPRTVFKRGDKLLASLAALFSQQHQGLQIDLQK